MATLQATFRELSGLDETTFGNPSQNEIRSLAAGVRKAAEFYRANPDKIAWTIVIDLYLMIARLAEQLAREEAS